MQGLEILFHTLKKIPVLIRAARFFRSFSSPRQRSIRRLLRDNPGGLFQPCGETSPDRYPRIFAFVQKRLSDVSAPRLLSFGCATGEEVFSLRKYFLTAEITGIDINPQSIAICNKKLKRSGDSKIRFQVDSSANAEPEEHYDAIFCMAVLRHGGLGVGRAQRCDHLIRFADFEHLLSGLCRSLKPGGYLVIRHSNFRFSDIPAAAEFDVVFSILHNPEADPTPLYGPDDRLLEHEVYNDTVFRKREQPEHVSNPFILSGGECTNRNQKPCLNQ